MDHSPLVPIRSVACHDGSMDHCPKMPIGSQFRSQTAVKYHSPISPVLRFHVSHRPPMECRLERRWNGYGPRTDRYYYYLSSLIDFFCDALRLSCR